MSHTSRYAYAKHPVICAIVNGMYRFRSAAQAQKKLAWLAEKFTVARKQPKDGSLLLWIRDYALAGDDKKEGVVGHYAIVAISETGGRFVLAATKLDVPAKEHPQRALIKRKSPNWGHPVLRAVRKEKAYPSREAALKDMFMLSRDFPAVATATADAVYILIYCSNRPANARMVKFKLSVKLVEGEGFRIECAEQVRKPRPAQKPRPTRGKFTARLTARKKPKA